MSDRHYTFPVVVITGPIGAGKTTVSGHLGQVLEGHAVPHTVLDMDELRDTWPHPADDPFNVRLGHRNLADVMRNCRAAGSSRAVIADIVESREQRDAYRQAIPGAVVTVIRLVADLETLRSRIARRARGDDQSWELERAAELIEIMETGGIGDLLVDTAGRAPGEIAHEIATRLGWLLGDKS